MQEFACRIQQLGELASQLMKVQGTSSSTEPPPQLEGFLALLEKAKATITVSWKMMLAPKGVQQSHLLAAMADGGSVASVGFDSLDH